MTSTSPRIAATAACFVALLLAVTSLCGPARAAGFPEAVGLMKREQILGEANAGLLKTFAKYDTGTFARGIQLYALAQAHFNALIETLKAELIAGEALEDSQGFAVDLQRAANRRVDFTDFVEQKVLSRTEQGTKSLAAVLGGADFIQSAADLITALNEAGLDIWRAYRAAEDEQRQQILDQLDSLKWRPFGEVPALG
jgi:hypothetical protein